MRRAGRDLAMARLANIFLVETGGNLCRLKSVEMKRSWVNTVGIIQNFMWPRAERVWLIDATSFGRVRRWEMTLEKSYRWGGSVRCLCLGVLDSPR